MIHSSYLLALLAGLVYVIGFLAIHKLTTAKWFALEVLFGGIVGALGLALGLRLVPQFRVEYYVALYGVLWFCFFFISGIFYASISLAIVRYLSQEPGMSATVGQIYADCIVAPFLERAQFLTRIGQAISSNASREPDGSVRYCISPAGARNAARIRLVQRVFGFGTTGYYSVPNAQDCADSALLDVTGRESSQFMPIVASAIVGLSLAETCVTHGVRESMRSGWIGVGAVLVLSVAFFFAVRAAVHHLSSRSGRDPSSWVLWAPLAAVLLLAQLAGLQYGASTITSDGVVLAATGMVVLFGLYTIPIRSMWPLFLAWMAAIYFWYTSAGTGMVHNEVVDHYVPAYLTKRPWLDILFDPDIEFGDNRSRPVSLVFDFIDYRLVQASARLGYPHFKMPSYPAFALASMGTAYWFFVRDLKLSRSVAALIVMLYQTAPALAFLTLYRSAKVGAALMIIVVFTTTYRFIVAAEMGMKMRASVVRLVAIWAGCMMLPMFDELGTYSIGMLLACLSVYAVVRRTKHSWAVWCVVLSTLGGAYVYRYAVSESLYAWIHGAVLERPYNMNRELYANIQLEVLLKSGTELALDTFRFEFGNMSRGVVVAITVLLLVVYSTAFRVRWGGSARARSLPLVAGLVLCGVLAMVVAQLCIMIHFHPPIGSYADVRRVYYVLPTLALFMMIVAVGLKTVCAGHQDVSRTVSVVLALCLVGNIEAAGDHRQVLRSGHLASFFNLSDTTVANLRNVQRGMESPSPLAGRLLGR